MREKEKNIIHAAVKRHVSTLRDLAAVRARKVASVNEARFRTREGNVRLTAIVVALTKERNIR